MKFLMLQDTPIYDIEGNMVLEEKLCPFLSDRDSAEAFQWWLKHRIYLKTNRAAERLVRQLGGEDVAEVKRRLSLSDSYWVQYDYDWGVLFDEITPYLNKFSEGYTVGGGVQSSSVPEFVLGGSQPKVWGCGEEGLTYLRKMELPEQIRAEMLSVRLLRETDILCMDAFVMIGKGRLYADRFNSEISIDNLGVINLVNITNLEKSLIQLDQLGIFVDGWNVRSVYTGYLKAGVVGNFKELLVSQIVADAVVGNIDRKFNNSNWAIFIDNLTGERSLSTMYDFNWSNLVEVNYDMLKEVALGFIEFGVAELAVGYIERLRLKCVELGLVTWKENAETLLSYLGRGQVGIVGQVRVF